ncbi:helix-turn-helix transcriptional regulator [Kineosporia sp. R_H_3]|uniref:helix-turn-helix domain-containing protein n=1 Tax=Kineosporia sp. R_H_3 TaxID=1961848 RepID=UPI000B4AD019|nr:helix-turn-helix transcriptional regulator [Kineosporia sp. R_H_3]
MVILAYPDVPNIAEHCAMTPDESRSADMADAHADAQEDARRRLRNFVTAQMGAPTPPISRLALAKKAGIDRDTLANWLDGKSWPHGSRRAAVEAALRLPPGTFDAVYEGRHTGEDVPQTPETEIADAHLSQMVVTFDPSALSDLSPTEREEVEAAAKAAALRRIREIRGQQ